MSKRPRFRPFRRPPPIDTRQLPPQGSLLWSFTWAFEGMVFALRTQRNMWIHVSAGLIALLGGLLVGLTRIELVLLLLVIALVLIAEMMNTALEAAIDAVVEDFRPLVKIAKDVAAGAVLVAAGTALIVGFLLFESHLADLRESSLDAARQSPSLLVVVILIMTVLVTVAVKAHTGSGTPLRGGLPSGHTAAAFAAWASISILAGDVEGATIISGLALLMALLVAQSRMEAGIHSLTEVIAGAVIGAGIALLLFQVWA